MFELGILATYYSTSEFSKENAVLPIRSVYIDFRCKVATLAREILLISGVCFRLMDIFLGSITIIYLMVAHFVHIKLTLRSKKRCEKNEK